MITRLREFGSATASALFVGIITALLTLTLAYGFSNVLAGQDQIRHRDSSRCVAFQTLSVLNRILEAHNIDSSVPNVNIQGLDCSIIFDPVDQEAS